MMNGQDEPETLHGDDVFRPATGMSYLGFLNQLHQIRHFDWYLEIGTQTGASLAYSRSKSISVDPSYQIQYDTVWIKPVLHFFQMTSDEFFDSEFLMQNGIKVSFAFLDGMHQFEYLLRDFMNAEAASDPLAVIAMHDCCPFDNDMEQRDFDAVKGGEWTGDVWKMIPILRKYRPDLSLTVLDCSPTGLVLVRNLDPGNTVLRSNYDAIISEFTDVRLDEYGLSRFNSQFEYTSGEEEVHNGFSLFTDVPTVPVSKQTQEQTLL